MCGVEHGLELKGKSHDAIKVIYVRILPKQGGTKYINKQQVKTKKKVRINCYHKMAYISAYCGITQLLTKTFNIFKALQLA